MYIRNTMAINTGAFRLNELSEEKLNLLIGMSEEEKTIYIDNKLNIILMLLINKKCMQLYNNLIGVVL